MAILLDVVILGAFVLVKLGSDPLTVGVSLGVAALIAASQWFVVRRTTKTRRAPRTERCRAPRRPASTPR